MYIYIDNVSKDLLLYGRYVQDNNISKYNATSSRVNGILQNKNNMSRDIKGKLYSFYTDIVSANKPEDKHKNISINRMVALGNNKPNSIYANRNYDEIRQRESVEKTKHEIYDMLSNPPPTKRLRKSHSHIDMFYHNLNNNNNNINNKTSNMFSNGIRSQITRLLSKRVTPNPKPHSKTKNIRSFNSTTNNNNQVYNGGVFPHKDFELYMNKDYYTKNDKCSKLETKLKLYSL